MNQVYMSPSNHKLLIILFCFLASCAPKQSFVVSSTNSNLNISNDFGGVDASVLAMIEPYKSKLDGQMDELIGTLTATMDKEKPNSPLINFMADAMYEVAKLDYTKAPIDAAMMNYGGVRLNSIPKGPITVRGMYELMPFDNTMVIVHLDSIKMQRLLDKVADYGGWPISKGVLFELYEGRAINATINGQALNAKNKWVVALPNYVAEGGDGTTFLIDAPKEDTGIFIRDMLIKYVRMTKEIVPDLVPRIIVSNEKR